MPIKQITPRYRKSQQAQQVDSNWDLYKLNPQLLKIVLCLIVLNVDI